MARARFGAFAGGVILAASLSATEAAAAAACAAPAAENLLYFACEPKAALLLLPEDAATAAGAGAGLTVTGGYTATDRRAGDKPKPVGLFARAGEIASREYVRFDGVLLIEAGRLSLHHRRRVGLGGRLWDLEEAAERADFLDRAKIAGASLLQSHLLIIEGEVDTARIADAPVYRRRILFTRRDGAVGVWDSGERAMTLHQAAEAVHRLFAPRMALNLDMGSYDFCLKDGALCGALGRAQTGKLSNMLRLDGE